MQELGIGWSFYHQQIGQKVVCGLCIMHADRSSISPIISTLETALVKTKENEGDLRDFPVHDVLYDIAKHTGNEVEVDANLQHYGAKSFGEGCFDPNFVFSRVVNNQWMCFTYGTDGGLDELSKFLFN